MHLNLLVGAVFDRDFWCEEEISARRVALSETLALVHFHSRKEVENYLLVPSVLQRAVGRYSIGRPAPCVDDILVRLSDPMKAGVQAQYLTKRGDFLRGKTKKDAATVNRESLEWFDSQWACLDTRMLLVPGKDLLKAFRNDLQKDHGVNLTETRIVDCFHVGEVPPDLLSLIDSLEAFRSKTPPTTDCPSDDEPEDGGPNNKSFEPPGR
jgi:hypothetical protein